MAAKNQGGRGAPDKTQSTSGYDESLDFFSEKFNPLKALLTPGIQVPVPGAKVHDNISMYESALRGLRTARPAKPVVAETAKFERNFLPHQLPVRTERSIRRNILDRIEEVSGPLAVLKRCMDERLRIKVWTRHSHGIRGFCAGYLAVFDKHWNMALEDVTEEWSRPVKKKVPAYDQKQTDLPKTNRLRPPKIVIKSTTKKIELCQRTVPQLLVRGEQVAFVQLCT